MFGLGHWELLIILMIVVVLFGAKRLPGLGKGLGEGLRGFREAMRGKEEDSEAQSRPPAPRDDESQS